MNVAIIAFGLLKQFESPLKVTSRFELYDAQIVNGQLSNTGWFRSALWKLCFLLRNLVTGKEVPG